ncbi:MAG: alpha/beta hydrolase [Actinomycetaceae bacterium]|nr:alpha/beta hydrolase [Actinomycetaceae bacterium]
MLPRHLTVAAALALGGTLAAAAVSRCQRAVEAGRQRLALYPAQTVDLPSGPMTFIEGGNPDGPPLLVLHGMFGGYDQALDIGRTFVPHCRILAPSRFGYPGTPISGSGSPQQQATHICELLDYLGVDSAYILGTSAGGTATLRFALDHPSRTRGVILFSSAMPWVENPARYAEYQGPPSWLCNDCAMFLLSPFFPIAMGMPAKTLVTMMPVGQRRAGAILDASVNNPDMARNFAAYPVETLECPVLIIQAKDDKVAPCERAIAAFKRFPRADMQIFEEGGHLLAGHEGEVRDAIEEFIGGARVAGKK